ncbi:MAG: hypothetical protein L6R42_006484 [Xanthoria sp. 1 TBL-2021]|nr:MAG: hypothetical protein L6R42_006484 [Xanthoria sp. 1 TBL-2021]
MHPAPRSSYDSDVDFSVLALQDPDFKTQFNYILWIQDLLDTTSTSYDDRYDPDREVVGLDMFVPFLLQIYDGIILVQNIDEKNLSYARQNILANNLKSRIRPLLTKPNDPLIPLDALGLEKYIPPFLSQSLSAQNIFSIP